MRETDGNIADIKVVTVYDGIRYQACAHVGKANSAYLAGATANNLCEAYEDLLRASSWMLWKFQKDGGMESGFIRI